MDLRVLPRQSSERASNGHLRIVRPGPRRLRASMDLVFIEANRGRLSGMARSAGLDCREIPPLRSRRARSQRGNRCKLHRKVLVIAPREALAPLPARKAAV